MANSELTEEGRKLRAEYLRKWRERMTEEQKERRNEFARRYYQEHKSAFKAYRANYWNNKAKNATPDKQSK